MAQAQRTEVIELMSDEDEKKYLPKDVLLGIRDKLDDTLSFIYKEYNLEQQTEVACEKRWQNISAEDDILNKIRETMCTLVKLRNNLYEDFRPQSQMLEELQLSDEITETTTHRCL